MIKCAAPLIIFARKRCAPSVHIRTLQAALVSKALVILEHSRSTHLIFSIFRIAKAFQVPSDACQPGTSPTLFFTTFLEIAVMQSVVHLSLLHWFIFLIWIIWNLAQYLLSNSPAVDCCRSRRCRRRRGCGSRYIILIIIFSFLATTILVFLPDVLEGLQFWM